MWLVVDTHMASGRMRRRRGADGYSEYTLDRLNTGPRQMSSNFNCRISTNDKNTEICNGTKPQGKKSFSGRKDLCVSFSALPELIPKRPWSYTPASTWATGATVCTCEGRGPIPGRRRAWRHQIFSPVAAAGAHARSARRRRACGGGGMAIRVGVGSGCASGGVGAAAGELYHHVHRAALAQPQRRAGVA